MQRKIGYLGTWLFAMAMAHNVTAQMDLPDIDTTEVKIDRVVAITSRLAARYDAEHTTETTQGILRGKAYNKLIEDRFTYLSYQRGAFPVGNSASLDFLENATQLKLGLAKKWVDASQRPSVIGSLGIQAKLGSGVANLFSGDIPTTGMSISGNLSILFKNFHTKQEVTRFINGKEVPTTYGRLAERARKLKDDFRRKNVTAFDEDYPNALCRLRQIAGELDTLDSNCKRYSDLILERSAIEARLTQANLIDGSPKSIAAAMEANYEEAYYTLFTREPAWDWFRLQWIDIGIVYNRSSYTIYDGTRTLSTRFDTKDFDAVGLKITYNTYKDWGQLDRRIRSVYANVSYEPRLTNSYADLSDISISKAVQVASSGDTTYVFQTNKSAKNVTSKPFVTTWQHSFSGALTLMTGPKKNFGLNLFAQGQYSTISKPIYNTRAGFIFTVTNNNFDPTNKESKAKINFEFFVQFSDLNDVAETHKSPWEKRVMGLSTNIPFSKILLN